MGLVTALGNDVATTWDGPRRGPERRPDDRGVRPVAADVADRRPRSTTSTRAASSIARSSAGPTATSSSGSWPRARRSTRPGCPSGSRASSPSGRASSSGTGLGGVGTLIDGFTTNALRGPDRISPFLIPMGIPNIGAGQVAIQFGMTGPNFTTVSACATGGHALGESSEIIRRGDADVMVAGGAEAGIYEAIVGGFAAMRALSTRNDDPEAASRPFDTGARRLRHRRGRGRRHPRGARARRGARRDDPGRAGRLRRDGRRLAHHAARARRDRRRPGGPPRARQGRPRRRRHRPRQRPRDLDARGRQGRAPGDPDDLRRRTPAGSRSRPTSRCSATRSARPARSRRSSRS